MPEKAHNIIPTRMKHALSIPKRKLRHPVADLDWLKLALPACTTSCPSFLPFPSLLLLHFLPPPVDCAFTPSPAMYMWKESCCGSLPADGPTSQTALFLPKLKKLFQIMSHVSNACMLCNSNVCLLFPWLPAYPKGGFSAFTALLHGQGGIQGWILMSIKRLSLLR